MENLKKQKVELENFFNEAVQPKKYRAEVTGVKEMNWSCNSMEYDTKEEAEKWLDGLSDRWFGYDLSRVVTTDTPNREPVDFENNIFYQKFRS